MDGTGMPLPEVIAAAFASLPQVHAVALAGSRGGNHADECSDIDLYVYAVDEPPEAWRTQLGQQFGERISIGNHFWETGDEWAARFDGTVVDIMYRTPQWIEGQLDRVLTQHQASVGYSTCFWYNVLHSRALHDPSGWYAALQLRAAQPYPEELRRAIVAKNHPILRGTLSSYRHQISLALTRDDHVSINHRVTALLASYFDILFAVNRLPHPGEKRLVKHAKERCAQRPPDLQDKVLAVLHAASPHSHEHLLDDIDRLLDGLDGLLQVEGVLG